MDGIINVYKEKGFTSHDVVSIVKRLMGTKKAGHAGTLDPDAEGVLLVLIGRATKLSDYLMSGDKEYRATVKFGASTSTYDASGEITARGNAGFTETELLEAISSFIGEQEQVPPMYSAIKSGGKKLYDLARKGVEIEREARKIVIEDVFLEEFNGFDEAVIYIKCGKGTYIRSICHDLGQMLGCGAYMADLTRTKVGSFDIKGAVKLADLKAIGEKYGKNGLEKALIPLEKALERYNKIFAPEGLEKLLYNGAKIESRLLNVGEKIEALNVIYDNTGSLIGIYEAVTKEGEPQLLKLKTMLRESGND